MVQAGLLKNPTFGAELGFRLNNGAQRRAAPLARAGLPRPLRAAAAEGDRARAVRGRHAARRAPRARSRRRGREGVRRRAGEPPSWSRSGERSSSAAAAAAELSQRQLDAGNISELDRDDAAGDATSRPSSISRARSSSCSTSRERINRLLGLWGETTTWRLAEALPPLPAAEPSPRAPRVARHERSASTSRSRGGRRRCCSKAVDLARTTPPRRAARRRRRHAPGPERPAPPRAEPRDRAADLRSAAGRHRAARGAAARAGAAARRASRSTRAPRCGWRDARLAAGRQTVAALPRRPPAAAQGASPSRRCSTTTACSSASTSSWP